MESSPAQLPPSSVPRSVVIPAYGRPTGRKWSGRGIMAMGLTMLIPGLGQIAAGRTKRGLLWFIAFICIMSLLLAAAIWPAMVPIAAGAILVSALLTIAGWIDAFRIGARSERSMLGRPLTRFLVGWMAMVIGLLGIPSLPFALCIRQFLCEAFIIPTASMAPTVGVGDRMLAHKLASVHRWSIIVFRPPIQSKEIWVKRVVGLPGETIELVDGAVTINGHAIALPPGMMPPNSAALAIHNATAGHPLTLKSDEYFVIGDNSPRSYDSRFWPTGTAGHQAGAVPANSIIGVATYIYWPVIRWKRLY